MNLKFKVMQKCHVSTNVEMSKKSNFVGFVQLFFEIPGPGRFFPRVFSGSTPPRTIFPTLLKINPGFLMGFVSR